MDSAHRSADRGLRLRHAVQQKGSRRSATVQPGTPRPPDRLSADQPGRGVARFDRESLQRRAPVVAFTAPASGLNALWGPRTIAPVPTWYSAACHGHCGRPSSVTRPVPSEANRWWQRLETANGLPALVPTASAPCGVCCTTTTCEAPRSSTATSRAAHCSEAVTRALFSPQRPASGSRQRSGVRSGTGRCGRSLTGAMLASTEYVGREHGLYRRHARDSRV
jgi:hypothetical protein